MPEAGVTGTPLRLRILFAIESPEFLRCYGETLRLLADRGHAVIVAVNALESKQARLELIGDDRIEIAGVVPSRKDVWASLLWNLRATMDFVHYLDPRFADTPMLRERMYRKILPALLRPLGWFGSLPRARVTQLIRGLQAFARAVPINDRVSRFLCAQRPDVVVVSPLVYPASDQDDIVQAARAAGIPVVAGIASWDNLTSKGRMRVDPDAVLVWNEHQRREAIELHGVEPARVVVTGAQTFDHWFERRPSRSRQEFCRTVGLPDDRPLILFAASSRVVGQSKRSRSEVPFVRRWLKALRGSSDPLLRDAAVLLRPHPYKPDQWSTSELADAGPIAIWPRERFTPAAEDARTSLFDSVYFCQAVVGINTSVMVEAAILRKPVLSILLPSFADMQDGTRHFRYLRVENGGFLRLATSIDEHLEYLAAALRNPAPGSAVAEQFVASFVRPHGVNTACTPLLADAIERVASRGPVSRQASAAGASVLCAMLWPVAVGLSAAKSTRRMWKVASAPPATEGLADRRGVFGTLMHVPRVGWHQLRPVVSDWLPRRTLRTSLREFHAACRSGIRPLAWAGRALRRVPRIAIRNFRHARYYVATVVLQRAAKNGNDT